MLQYFWQNTVIWSHFRTNKAYILIYYCIVQRNSWVVSPRVVSPSFINSALKNEIWKIPLQIFVFWMLYGLLKVLYFCLPQHAFLPMVFWTSLCSACSLENCTNGNERFFSKRIPGNRKCVINIMSK
jgi:hypothetical protein